MAEATSYVSQPQGRSQAATACFITMDNEPTTLFESYESDFSALINGVKEKLEGEAKDQRGGAFLWLSSLCLG